MIGLAVKNLGQRKLRSFLTLAGVSLAVALLASLRAFGTGYERELTRELRGMGIQMMLVPLGCPYDAAARVLKGNALDVSLPASAYDQAKGDPSIDSAAPLLMATIPNTAAGRTDLWVGVTDAIRPLKPWWKLKQGAWPKDDNSVMLGSEAAVTELREVGDKLSSPETGKVFTVCGILETSGTADDSQFFIPLSAAQSMFKQPGRLTAIAIRLKDPMQLDEASARLQKIPGAQVVSMTEMMGAFRNLLGAVDVLMQSIAWLAIAISGLAVFTTMMSAALERNREIGCLRAIGASRGQIFNLMAFEAVALAGIGSVLGIGVAMLTGNGVESIARHFAEMAPPGHLLTMTTTIAVEAIGVGLAIGVLAGLYPAWMACRLSPSEALRWEN